ncbi:DUF7554 family protein [Haloprofundus salinisoli]|uniref:DUF7554 family protein n=1 Tax=Haloprofundus salinisoli TaxID=2876193 RepID=UPI001CCFAD26|nr:hypothetical protein [Haloprofundus salinisoli]
MSRSRAKLDVEDLLKVVLVLVVVWLVLEIVETALGIVGGLLGPLQPLLGLIVVTLIVLWFFDRL